MLLYVIAAAFDEALVVPRNLGEQIGLIQQEDPASKLAERLQKDFIEEFGTGAVIISAGCWRRERDFEPPDLSVNGFQDRRLKPLGHPSTSESNLGAQALSRLRLTSSIA